MKVTRRHALAAGLGGAFSTLGLSSLHAEFDGPLAKGIEGGEEFWLATDAYIYGYPLVTMEMTRRVITNVASVAGTRGPMGQFIKLRQYPDASFRDVTAPNADTLYTTAFIDVGKDPWDLSIPDMKDGHRRADLRDHRPGLERHSSAWRQGIQIAHQHRLDPWAYLLHRNAGRLRRGSCLAGSVRAGAAELLWQTVYTACGNG